MAVATPESKVKKKVAAHLKRVGAYFFYPQTGGYGKSGVPDIIACHKGRFIGIECKAGKNTTTRLQEKNLRDISEAGGHSLVINENNIEDLVELLTDETRVSDAEGHVHIYNADGDLVRVEDSDGEVRHYKNGERVRTERSNGVTYHYKNGEHVCTELSDGTVKYFKGGELTRVEYPSGTVKYFKGGWLIRTEYPDGEVATYD